MQKSIVVGIAGGTGSGKTTVAYQIYQAVGEKNIAFLHHDSYYKDQSQKPFAKRVKTNYDHPNSLETDLLIKHIKELKNGQSIECPVYDFSLHNRTKETVKIDPKPVILVEGILIFNEKALTSLCDMKIFVDTDADVRFIRRLKRDIAERGRTMESVVTQYLETVRPMHLEFVEPSKRYADVIIPEGGFNKVAMNMVISRIKVILEEAK